jgi:hypothetical protein
MYMELSKIAWNFFKSSGDIEFYMLYQEMELQGEDKEPNQQKLQQKE